MERRDFLKMTSAGAPALAVGTSPWPTKAMAADSEPHLYWSLFAKQLQWLTTQAYSAANPYATGVLIGDACAEMGFSSLNLTVRPGGHVEPAQVTTNLPLMLNGIRSTGVDCFEITT